MARIYRAWDDVTQKDVAIKRLYPYFVGNEIVRKRFVSEGKIQQILAHPNIVTVFEIVEKPMLAIVMEFVQGETLDEHLARRGSLGEAEVLDILLPILSAIGFAHKRGIIHRDIKPSNILISKAPGVRNLKIMDFGVAKIKGKGTSLTATGTTVGTLHYMSPEQIVGSKNIDGRADIYSLGVTLYKLVTGEVPFNAPTEFALMMAQVEAAPLPPSKLNPNMSKDLERIILKAMAKKADDRFQTIREFTHALLQSNFSLADNNETITDRVSLEVLQFAMDADQVGQDMTGEMGLAPIAIQVDTQEQTQKIRQQKAEPEETMEISSAQLLSMSSSELSAVDEVEQTIEYKKLDASIADTVALEARVNLKSRARIVFDHAESQDLTAPKISQEAYDLVIGAADKEAATFENPNFRAENPGLFPKSTTRLGSLKEEPGFINAKTTEKSQSFPKARPTAPPKTPSFGSSNYAPPKEPSGLNNNFGSSSYPQQKEPSDLNNNFGSSSYPQQKEPSGLNNFGSSSYPQPKDPSGLNQGFGSSSYQKQNENAGINNSFGSSSYPQNNQFGSNSFNEKSGFNTHGADNSLPPGFESKVPPIRPTSTMAQRVVGSNNSATIPPAATFTPKKQGLDIKMVFAIAAAVGMVIIALTFLIFSILF